MFGIGNYTGPGSMDACITSGTVFCTPESGMKSCVDVVASHDDISIGDAPVLVDDDTYTYDLKWTDYTYTFRFSSQDNLDKFTAAPYDYAPKYGGFWAYGEAEECSAADSCGAPVYVSSATAWTIVDGDMYMQNHGIMDRGMWDSDKDIPLADDKWTKAFGSLETGPFNTGGCSDDGSTCQCYWPKSS